MSKHDEGGPETDAEAVLIPLEVLEGESLGAGIPDLVGPLPVVLLGYHVLPEQTPTDQARQQFEERAQGALAELAEPFAGPVETRLVFTHDAEQTIDRLADEAGVGAVLLPNPIADLDRLLVAVHGAVDVDRIATVVAALRNERDVDLTLFAAAPEERDLATDQLTALRERLLARGVPATAIAMQSRVGRASAAAIADAALDHDAVVMGERAPSWRELVFGDLAEQVATESLGPVIVVQRRD
jgi:nucleotide-binding universal stress UspA family protein